MFTYTPPSVEGAARGAPVARDLPDEGRRQGDEAFHELGPREGAAGRGEPLKQEELDPPRAHVALPRPGRADISQHDDDPFCLAGESPVEVVMPRNVFRVRHFIPGREVQSLACIVFGRLACQILCREICAVTQQRPNHLGVVRTGGGAHQRRRRVVLLLLEEITLRSTMRSNAYARIAAAIK